jgi:NADPH-dependent glutamate synthase beta subunit-like oxidoreductase
MASTDTSHPDYFHKVVDCQWACPAHTDVPEYIRLIAQGRFTDAYLVNRKSNVFPGILGRVCDRPCEPACRRGRVEEKPVAICRLKRVAADHKDEFRDRLPKIPEKKNGKRIACIGAGCASLTVANDLMPLGYEVTIFEQFAMAGGLMRTNIPSFRLPGSVIDEEISAIVDMGVDLRLGHRIDSMKKLLDEGFDAIFVGSGAPKGKELSLPGRQEGAANIHIGISWLESIAFGHIDSVGKNVLIIGVGNTAMDCCRSSLRLGAKSVKVMARKPRQFFKASEWELEDAEAESVEIVINRSPKNFVVENGRLKGMTFDVMEYDIDPRGRITNERITGEELSARKTHSPGSSATSESNSTNGMFLKLMSRHSKAPDPEYSLAAMLHSVQKISFGRSSTDIRLRYPFINTAKESPLARGCRPVLTSRVERWECTSGLMPTTTVRSNADWCPMFL